MKKEISFRSKKRMSSWKAKRRLASVKRFINALGALRDRFAFFAAGFESHVALIVFAFLCGFMDITSLPLLIPVLIFALVASIQRFLYQITFAFFWSLGIDAIVGQPVGSTLFPLVIYMISFYLAYPKVSSVTTSSLLKPIIISTAVVTLFEIFHFGLFGFQVPSAFEFLQATVTFLIVSVAFSLRFLLVEIFRTQKTSANRDGAIGFSGVRAYS